MIHASKEQVAVRRRYMAPPQRQATPVVTAAGGAMLAEEIQGDERQSSTVTGRSIDNDSSRK